MRPPARSAFALLLFGFGAPLASTAAQHVHGVVRDSAAQQPIGGAVVWVSDSAGRFLARAIADEAGHYSVMRLDGSAVMHVVRIGYHPLTLPITSARGGAADTTIDVRMGSIALMLGTMSESRSRICPGEKGTNAALELWEQARAALLASVVSRDAGAPALVTKSFSRNIDPESHRTSSQQVRTRRLVGDESYVAAQPAGIFVADGYMKEHNGDRTFYAPDDEVLLDPSFAGTHCLRVVDGGTGPHASEVGIAFAPVTNRGRDTLVDVQGVLWIAKNAHGLDSLEFHYTDLEREADVSGGEIQFQTMPTGAPMITRWVIRSAKLSVIDPVVMPGIRRRLFDRRDRTNVRLVGIREDGGYVVSATWPDGKQWRAPMRTIIGQLLSDATTPVGGMSVWLENTADTTISDADGYFVLHGVVPGSYSIMAADSSLAKVGVVRGRRTIDVLEGDRGLAHVLYFPLARITQLQCGKQPHDAGTGVLLGRVVDESGNGLTDVDLDATWTSTPAGSTRAPNPDRSTETDETGRFAICGAPIGAKVKLHAVTSTSATDVEWVQQELLTLTFVMHSTAQ